MAPLKALGKPVGDLLQRRPYVTQQSLLDATQPKGRRYYWKSEYLPGIEPELLAKQREHAERIASPHSAVIVFPLGGAIASRPRDHSAVGNRDAAAVLNITARGRSPRTTPPTSSGRARRWRDMKRFSTGGTYVNFLTEEETGERIAAAYGKQPDAPRRDQGALGPGQPVPDEQEHRAVRAAAETDARGLYCDSSLTSRYRNSCDS